jgi:hypothetical protein
LSGLLAALGAEQSGHDRATRRRGDLAAVAVAAAAAAEVRAGRLLAREGGLVVVVRGLAALVALDAGRLLELLEAGVPLLVGELAGLLLEPLASELAELALEAGAELAEALLGELGGAGRLLGLVDLLLEVVALLLGGVLLGRLLGLDLALEVGTLFAASSRVDTFFSRSSTREAAFFSSSYSLRLISMVSTVEVLLTRRRSCERARETRLLRPERPQGVHCQVHPLPPWFRRSIRFQ